MCRSASVSVGRLGRVSKGHAAKVPSRSTTARPGSIGERGLGIDQESMGQEWLDAEGFFSCTSARTSPAVLAMHPLVAPDPLPVARVALAALDQLGGLLGLAMRYDGRHDRRDVVVSRLALFHLFHAEALFDEAGVEVPGHEAVRVHDALVEGDVGANSQQAVFLERAA